MKKIGKDFKNKKTQRSFYFEDYNYSSNNSYKKTKLNISEDRIYLLFFVFFCLISIFTIKIFIISIQDPFSKIETQINNGFNPLRSDIVDRITNQ